MFNWYVINTYSGHEKKVEANLHQRFRTATEDVRYAFREVIVPTEMVTETDKDGKKVQKEKRTLPGYLLVNMNMDNKNARLLVRDTPGITNFVGPLGEPVPLSRAEVARLIQKAPTDQAAVSTTAAAAEEKTLPSIQFELGEIVKVMSGPLTDFDGEVTEINPEQHKLKVLVSIFERQVPVELPYDQVQKI